VSLKPFLAARKVSFSTAIAVESSVPGRENKKSLLLKFAVLENGAPVVVLSRLIVTMKQ